MRDHRTELRRQLVDAARNQHPAPTESQRRPALLFIAAAAVVLAVAMVGVVVGDGRPAAAETFAVRVDAESLVIDVVGKVDDAEAAAEELEDAGIEVELLDVAAAPWLVGEIVAVSSESDEPAVEEAADGRVDSFRINADAPPRLTLMYGRAATEGETYEATSSAPGCGKWVGAALSEKTRSLLRAEYGDKLRWQQVSNRGIEQLDEGSLATDTGVVDIVPTSGDGAIVVVTDGSSAVPSGMTCR